MFKKLLKTAELCNGLNSYKYGTFFKSGLGTDRSKGILGLLEKC